MTTVGLDCYMRGSSTEGEVGGLLGTPDQSVIYVVGL